MNHVNSPGLFLGTGAPFMLASGIAAPPSRLCQCRPMAIHLSVHFLLSGMRGDMHREAVGGLTAVLPSGKLPPSPSPNPLPNP